MSILSLLIMKAKKVVETEETGIQYEQVTMTLSRDGGMSDEIRFQCLESIPYPTSIYTTFETRGRNSNRSNQKFCSGQEADMPEGSTE